MMRILSAVILVVSCAVAGLAQAEVDDNRALYHVFPQMADGRFPDGTGYRSTLIITTDNIPASCTWNFWGFGFQLPGFGNGKEFTLSVPAYGIYRGRSAGTQPFTFSGYATLSCSTPVTAQILYSYIAEDGHVISEATVFASPPVKKAKILLDVSAEENSHLGIALVNNEDRGNSFLIALDPPLPAMSRLVTLPARTQNARFAHEFILGLPDTYLGAIVIYSTTTSRLVNVYAIGLRYTGSAFTTLPVTSITEEALSITQRE